MTYRLHIASLVLTFFLNIATATLQAQVIDAEWIDSISGTWTDGSRWSTSPDFPNNGTPLGAEEYNVRFSGSPTHYITLNTDVAVNSVTLESPHVVLGLYGSTLETSHLRVSEGTFVFRQSGPMTNPPESTIRGATITGDAGRIEISAERTTTAVLDDVSLGMALNVPASTEGNSPKLLVRNGLELLDGTAVTLTGSGATMKFDGTQSLLGLGEIRFVNDSPRLGSGAMTLALNTSLTIGREVTVGASGISAYVGAENVFGEYPFNVGLINEGHLLANSDSPVVLSVMNNTVERGVTFTNRGVAEVVHDNSLVIGGDWTNEGIFRVRNNGVMYLGGRFDSDQVGTIDRQGGKIYVSGEVINEGRSFTANAMTGDLVLGREGISIESRPIVHGGRINADEGARWTFQSYALEGVTLATDVDVRPGSRMDIYGDLTLEDAHIRMTRAPNIAVGTLNFLDIDTPQSIRGRGTIEYVAGEGRGSLGVVGELQIERDVRLLVNSRTVSVGGQTLTNDGTIEVGAGILRMDMLQLMNRGTIDVTGHIQIGTAGSTWHNAGVIRLHAGARAAFAGTYEISDFGQFVDEGAAAVELGGTIDNRERILDFDTLETIGPISINGAEILGGVLDASSDLERLQVVNGILLNAVTLATDFPNPIEGSVWVKNGLTLDHTQSAFPPRTSIQFSNTEPQTLTGPGTLVLNQSRITSSSALTIDRDVIIRTGTSDAANAEISFYENQGRIILESPRAVMTIGHQFTPWTSSGSIEVHTGTLRLDGIFRPSDLTTIQNSGGEIELFGTLHNIDDQWLVDSTFGTPKFRAQVDGGRIEMRDGIVADLGGAFSNVTFAGDGRLYDHDSGTRVGELFIRGSFAMDHATVTMAPRTELRVSDLERVEGIGEFVLNGTPASTKLIFANGVALSPGISIGTGPAGGGSLMGIQESTINEGRIAANYAHQQLVVSGILNYGVFETGENGRLSISDAAWGNDGIIRLHGGLFEFTGTSFDNHITGHIYGSGTMSLSDATFINHGSLSTVASTGQLLLITDAVFAPESQFAAELGPAHRQNGFASARVLGALQLGGELDVKLEDAFHLAPQQSFTILTATRGITGGFEGLAEGDSVGIFDGVQVWITYQGGAGNDVVLFTAVAEPCGCTLLWGVTALFVTRHRRTLVSTQKYS